MLKNKPVFYGTQEDGKFYTYQYFINPISKMQKLILAENITTENDAKLIAKLLIQNIEKE